MCLGWQQQPSLPHHDNQLPSRYWQMSLWQITHSWELLVYHNLLPVPSLFTLSNSRQGPGIPGPKRRNGTGVKLAAEVSQGSRGLTVNTVTQTELSNPLGCQAGILARSLPSASNQGAAPREVAAFFFLRSSRKHFYCEGSTFPPRGLQTALELLGNPRQQIASVVSSPWSPTASGEGAPPPSPRLVRQWPLRFLSRACGPCTEPFCLVAIICEWIWMCVILERESIVFIYVLRGTFDNQIIVISALGVWHASKEYGLRSQRSAPIPALPLPNWEVNYSPLSLDCLICIMGMRTIHGDCDNWDNIGKYMQMMHVIYVCTIFMRSIYIKMYWDMW